LLSHRETKFHYTAKLHCLCSFSHERQKSCFKKIALFSEKVAFKKAAFFQVNNCRQTGQKKVIDMYENFYKNATFYFKKCVFCILCSRFQKIDFFFFRKYLQISQCFWVKQFLFLFSRQPDRDPLMGFRQLLRAFNLAIL